MDAALRERFVPALRARGVTGSLPHFRRRGSDRIDLLTVQFDKYGGGFVLEVGRCEPEGVTMHWGLKIPPNKVTAHDMSVRHRLGSSSPGQDGRWFRFDHSSTPDRVAVEAATALTEADAWWDSAPP